MKKIYKEIESKLLSGKVKGCSEIAQTSSDIASQLCSTFVNEMTGEEPEHPCPCSGDGSVGSNSSEVDLIVLVDSSGSMSSAWTEIEKAVVSAAEAAQETCEKKANIVPLFVDRNDPGTDSSALTSYFQDSHEQYLRDNGHTGTFYSEQSDAPYGQGHQHEEGAEAIRDLCEFFPWREGACRAIFYLSDEWLDGGNSEAEDRAKLRVPEALAAAMSNNVTLFAHHLSTGGGNSSVQASHDLYVDLCVPTGGFVIRGQTPTAKLYEEVLTKAICESCNNAAGCAEVDWPEIAPCVHISWGASKCDGIESHDDEVICITLCNCYSNVTFKNVRIGYVVVVDENGNLPPLLPDGTPSVHLYPTGPVCYGDIGPCVEDEEVCVSRQFVMLTRGAVAGNYKVKIGGICFETCQGHNIEIEKDFKICKD